MPYVFSNLYNDIVFVNLNDYVTYPEDLVDNLSFSADIHIPDTNRIAVDVEDEDVSLNIVVTDGVSSDSRIMYFHSITPSLYASAPLVWYSIEELNDSNLIDTNLAIYHSLP